LADLLDKVMPLSCPVIDMTGLKGRYRLLLEVSMSDSVGGERMPGNRAAEIDEAALKAANEGLKKLGLQLERRRGVVETLVVDRADKMPTEN